MASLPFRHLLFFFLLLLPLQGAWAVDETASDLIAFGQINLTHMTDTLNQKYPATRKAFWNVTGIAYHDFSGGEKDDVVIGLSGYQDKGLVYNGDKQLVEDTGAAFAYFHKVKDEWKLSQVEMVEGKHYEGFEGADLTGEGKDQLVVYSSQGATQIANIYTLGGEGLFHPVTRIASNGMGPRVSKLEGKILMVDYQRARINNCDDCLIYYGRPYQWDGKRFAEGADEYLDQVSSYDALHATDDQCSKYLSYFENYLKNHPDDFSCLANCYDLSQRLEDQKDAVKFQAQLEDWGDRPAACPYCDSWLKDRNKVHQDQYLNQIEGKPKVSEKFE